MNKTITLLTTSTLLLLTTAATNAQTFEATDDAISTQICIAAAEGNKARLNRTIANFRLNKTFVANKIKCNGQDITTFVAQHGKSSENIVAMLNKYLENKDTHNIKLAKH